MMKWRSGFCWGLVFTAVIHVAGNGASLTLHDGQVMLDFGQTLPGRPTVWPGDMHLHVLANSPWQLLVKADGDFMDPRGRFIPVDRLSWSLATQDGQSGPWQSFSKSTQMITADDLPTGTDGQSLALRYRFLGSWDDPVGGPFTTTMQMSLVTGIELMPAYVYPQPLMEGQVLQITYWTGDGQEGVPFVGLLQIRDLRGEIVKELATQGAFASWVSEQLAYGEWMKPGHYFFSVLADGDLPVAQGFFQVMATNHLLAQGFRVEGQVDAAGTPALGAKVSLFSAARRLMQQKIVDDKARFEFDDLAAGTYFIEVELPGYWRWRSELFTLDELSPTRWERAKLVANNALFLVASLEVLPHSGSFIDIAADRGLGPGDSVRITGQICNQGTRPVRNIQVRLDWPSSLPLMGEIDSDRAFQFAELSPGQSASFEYDAVIGLGTSSLIAAGRHIISVHADGWVQAKADAKVLEIVQAPTCHLSATTSQEKFETNGAVALYVFREEDEKPIPGVGFRVGETLWRFTDKNGWLIQSVSAGAINIYVPAKYSGGTQTEPLCTVMVRPGAMERVHLSIGADGTPRLMGEGNNQLVLGCSWIDGKPVCEAAGHVTVMKEDRRWSWSLPTQIEYVRYGGANKSVKQNWRVDFSKTPHLAWGYHMQGDVSLGERTDKLSLSVGVNQSGGLSRRTWPAKGVGPYDIGEPVRQVKGVVVFDERQKITLQESDYTWNFEGQLWLIRPPLSFLGTSVEGDVKVEVSYLDDVDFDLDDTPQTLKISLQGQPRGDKATPDLVEEVGLEWSLADSHGDANAPLWRATWKRKTPGSKFLWEGGNPQKAVDANSLFVADREEADNSLPYVRVEQQWEKKNSSLTLKHEKKDLLRTQSLMVDHRLRNAPLKMGVELTRWRGAHEEGARADVLFDWRHDAGEWRWHARQRVNVFEIGSYFPDDELSWRHASGGSFYVQRVGEDLSGPRLGLHLATGGERNWLEIEQELSRGQSARVNIGGFFQHGRLLPRLRWQWQQLDFGICGLPDQEKDSVQIDTLLDHGDWSVSWQGIYGQDRTRQTWRLQGTKALQHGDLAHVVFAGQAQRPTGKQDYTFYCLWSGQRHLFDHLWQLDLQLRQTHSRAGHGAKSIYTVIPAGNIRFMAGDELAFCVGQSFTNLRVEHAVETKVESWCAVERRMGLWEDQAMWGSFRMHFAHGRWQPRFHFELRKIP